MRRLVLGIAVAVTSLMPIVGMADDQQIADFIKTRLEAEQQQGNLQGFNVDMRVERGTVWFKGEVSNARQEMTILKTAQAAAHLGVLQVVDDIEVAAAMPTPNYPSTTIPAAASQAPARQVAYQQGRSLVPAQTASFGDGGASGVRAVPAQTASFGSGSGSRSVAMPSAPGGYTTGSFGDSPAPYASSAPCQGPGCGYSAPYSGGSASYGTPVPMGGPIGSGGGGVGGPTSESPSLPGYAWPSYAAHPNFGNVSYPQQYSPSAWPYIGPFYPYPQVPLGWRKVSLEWDDGFWQLDFHDK